MAASAFEALRVLLDYERSLGPGAARHPVELLLFRMALTLASSIATAVKGAMLSIIAHRPNRELVIGVCLLVMLHYLRVLHVPILQLYADLADLSLRSLSVNLEVEVVKLPKLLLLVIQLKLYELALLVEIGLLWQSLVDFQQFTLGCMHIYRF